MFARPSSGMPAARFCTSIAALLGLALVVALALRPSAAGAATRHESFATLRSWGTVVGRFWVGKDTVHSDGDTWQPASALHPVGGRVSAIAAARAPTVYQQTRRGIRTLTVPTSADSSYRVLLLTMQCATRCVTKRVRVTFDTSTNGPVTIAVPSQSQSGGISTVIVKRLPKPTRRPTGGASSVSTSWLQPQNVFGATSVWTTNISSAPVANNSPAQVANLTNQVTSEYNGNAAFNVNEYDVSWYNAAPGQPTTTVQFTDCQHRGYTPSVLYAGGNGPFDNVPIPSNAQPAKGTDGWMTIYSASTDQLWDFWEASHDSSGWHACWGGRIDHASSNPGYFADNTGASASGMAIEAGDISITDATQGSINHAMSLAILKTAQWNNVSWPAQRSDGSDTSAGAIPEGTRLRLNPAIDVNSLNLSPLGKMIARAAQQYGFIVTDQAGCVAVFGEDGAAAQQATGTNPWTNLLGGTEPYMVMHNFPWSSLQALPKSYGAPH